MSLGVNYPTYRRQAIKSFRVLFGVPLLGTSVPKSNTCTDFWNPRFLQSIVTLKYRRRTGTQGRASDYRRRVFVMPVCMIMSVPSVDLNSFWPSVFVRRGAIVQMYARPKVLARLLQRWLSLFPSNINKRAILCITCAV